MAQQFVKLKFEQWIVSQLSIAKQYGAIYVNNMLYFVDENNDLIRLDYADIQVEPTNNGKKAKVRITSKTVEKNLQPYDSRCESRLKYQLQKAGYFIDLNMLPRVKADGQVVVMIPKRN